MKPCSGLNNFTKTHFTPLLSPDERTVTLQRNGEGELSDPSRFDLQNAVQFEQSHFLLFPYILG